MSFKYGSVITSLGTHFSLRLRQHYFGPVFLFSNKLDRLMDYNFISHEAKRVGNVLCFSQDKNQLTHGGFSMLHSANIFTVLKIFAIN